MAKSECPDAPSERRAESAWRRGERALKRANGILAELGSTDKLLRFVAYGSLLAKGLLLERGVAEDSPRMRALSDFYAKMSTTRFILHVTGGPAQLGAALEAWRARCAISGNGQGAVLAQLKVLMHASMALYFPFEHMIFLSRLVPNVLGTSDALWLRRTCMCWAVFNAAALADAGLRGAGAVRTSAAALDLVLATSWSMQQGFLGPVGVGAIGAWGGLAAFWQRCQAP